MTDVTVTTEFIRLDAFLKFCGAVDSGGEAKARIQNGEIAVAGAVCTQRGRKLRGGETVRAGQNEYRVVVNCIS